MHLFSAVPRGVLTLLFASLLLSLADAHSYFIVTSPTQGTQLQNGAANRITWIKGLLDDIDAFDVEMSRLSVDGLILVARDVPAGSGSFNLFLQDVPSADDYYLLFLNSTSGVMFTTSSRFSIGDSSSNATATEPDSSAPTVTISGGPNPLNDFATTFPPSANGVAMPGWKAIEGSKGQLIGLFTAMMLCMAGGAFTLL
ncbi:unnamed protein product [Somion occarium]|uniref:Uncharacterized protein n=1 Tax=Somion occarium TaxID=3059160 RepID=A0ABP1CSE3_9APHY